MTPSARAPAPEVPPNDLGLPDHRSPLSPIEVAGYQALVRSLPRQVQDVRLNRNGKTLLSLRGDPRTGLRLSLHRGLLQYPAALAEIPVWCAHPRRTLAVAIRQAIDDLFLRLGQRQADLTSRSPALAPLAGPFDPQACLDALHAAWFPDLPRPEIAWGPRRSPRRVRRVRFGAYYRSRPARILLNRVLDQPWVARAFAELVVYHELCHHAQACLPVRGETPHSPRFKAWERRFPGHGEILAWERANLHRFLVPEGGPPGIG